VTPLRVDVQIGELVLRGIPATDRGEVSLGFRQELERLLTGGDIPTGLTSPADITEIRTTWTPPGAGADPRELGSLIARTVYGSFSAGPARVGAAAGPSADPARVRATAARSADPGRGGASSTRSIPAADQAPPAPGETQ
jgi:hypothetical protein